MSLVSDWPTVVPDFSGVTFLRESMQFVDPTWWGILELYFTLHTISLDIQSVNIMSATTGELLFGDGSVPEENKKEL